MSGGRSSTLGPGPEFDRIRAVAGALGAAARGLGDDCARIDFPRGIPLVSTDVSVELVHFRRDWLRDEEIGWRAASAALSDLAAMGAAPAGLVVAVTMPPELDEAVLVDFMRGVGEAATSVGTAVLGGDLSRGSACALAVTVFGAATTPILRSGARPGDQLWVTGQLGGPRAALEAFVAGTAPNDEARARFAHPEPRIAAGLAFARLGASAMIDLSDGLVADAAHLAAASHAEVVLELEGVPVLPGTEAAAGRVGLSPQVFAAGSGEEYELLVALPSSVSAEAVARFAAELQLPITRIGDVRAGPPGVHATFGGKPVTVVGFQHFGGPSASR